MIPKSLSERSARLRGDLEELERGQQFVAQAHELRRHLNDILDWEHAPKEKLEIARMFLQQKDFNPELAYRALFAQAIAAFEGYMRDAIVILAEAIEKSVDVFEDLSEKVRKENIRVTGFLFKDVFNPPDHVALNFDEISSRIGTCITGRKDFLLNRDGFSLTISQITPTQIETALGRLGLHLDWDLVARNQAIRAVLGTQTARESANKLQLELSTMVRRRNRVVHSFGPETTINRDDLLLTIKLLQAFASGLEDLFARVLPEPYRAKPGRTGR